jgi:hypothetical protein
LRVKLGEFAVYRHTHLLELETDFALRWVEFLLGEGWLGDE